MTVRFVAGVLAKTNDGQNYSGLLELEAESESELLARLLTWAEEKAVDLSALAFDFVRTTMFRYGVVVFTHASEPVELLTSRLSLRRQLAQAA